MKRRYKNAKGEYDADFLTVVCWRGLADLVAKYLQKGGLCGVTGSIMTRSYVHNDGSTRHITEIVADEVEFLSGKREGNQSSEDSGQYVNQQGPAFEPGFTQVEDDELPF